MKNILDISQVARQTGLTSRALRFYEARGLLKPLRTASGRRLYGPGELERLNQILALKRAGLTLAQIQHLGDRSPLDLRKLINAQIQALETRTAELAEARLLLLSVKSRLDRGEAIDAATFCLLIRNGDSIMEADKWKQITDRYFTPDIKLAFRDRMGDVPEGFDQEDYGRKWQALSARIEAALPLDPGSDAAQALVDEWFALLKPFSSVATPDMWSGTVAMYDDMDNWPATESLEMGFSKRVWDFVRTATQARLERGGTIDGPAWMSGGKTE